MACPGNLSDMLMFVQKGIEYAIAKRGREIACGKQSEEKYERAKEGKRKGEKSF